jgi:hypothetical protein
MSSGRVNKWEGMDGPGKESASISELGSPSEPKKSAAVLEQSEPVDGAMLRDALDESFGKDTIA